MNIEGLLKAIKTKGDLWDRGGRYNTVKWGDIYKIYVYVASKYSINSEKKRENERGGIYTEFMKVYYTGSIGFPRYYLLNIISIYFIINVLTYR